MEHKEYILKSVEEEFSYMPYKEPSHFRVYIFFCINSGLLLFQDTPVSTIILNDLIENNIVKFDGFAHHQGEKSIRYRFTNYKYPSKFNRSIPKDLRNTILSKHDYRCAYCSSERNLHIDHIYPWSKGGFTCEENLQVLCQKCNLSKKNSY